MSNTSSTLLPDSTAARTPARPLQSLLFAVASFICGWLFLLSIERFEPGPPAGFQPYDFPKVNLATCYEPVIWPLESPGVTWGAVTGVAVDADDKVWICTTGIPPVMVFDQAGHFVKGWGNEYLSGAHQLRLDADGFVWVVDSHDHTVHKFTRDGERLMLLGTPGIPGDDDEHFNEPTDIAMTSNGHLYVADGYRNGRVVQFDTDGNFVRSWGTLGVEVGQLSLPHSIVSDSQDRLYVAERANGRIQVFDPQGNSLDIWQNLVVPWGMMIDRSDEIWVCGSSPTAWRQGDVALGTPPADQLLIKFDPTGRALQQWRVAKGQDGQEASGELNSVHCIAEDSQGALYCGDCKANRIIKLTRVGRGPLP
jgi:DNA-binding beta-propeller fold protein YncE